MLVKKPGFTAVMVLTLALGIGANTAIFSFLDRLVLRPLPVRKPGELVKVEAQCQYRRNDRSSTSTTDSFDYPLYLGCRDKSQVFSGLTAYDVIERMDELRVGDSVELVVSMAVSGNYFSVLGVKPVIGRFWIWIGKLIRDSWKPNPGCFIRLLVTC
jgi:hypothetical protein